MGRGLTGPQAAPVRGGISAEEETQKLGDLHPKKGPNGAMQEGTGLLSRPVRLRWGRGCFARRLPRGGTKPFSWEVMCFGIFYS